MDFKLKIKCEDCGCTFELRSTQFKLRDTLECPNCGNMLPDDVFQNLKTGIIALNNVPDHTEIPVDANPFDAKTHQFFLAVDSAL